ncbi:hypothetical protein D1007_61563 [Hordeum vulgare]|nr:hypothetical protein D1007_61563 [Hordeum vulgare]
MKSFMERAEAMLDGLSLVVYVRAEAMLGGLSLVVSVMQTTHMLRPLFVADGIFEVERGVELHGRFFPRARVNSPSLASKGFDNDVVVTSVLQIMPELRELCGGPVLPLFVEQLQVNPHEISSVALPPASPMELSQNLMSRRVALVMEHGALDVAALPSSATIEQVMPMSGMATEPGVLAPMSNPDALFAKDLCDLLASMEVVRPGLGRSDCFPPNRDVNKGRTKEGEQRQERRHKQGVSGCLMSDL